ncbi:MAG: tRNA (N6-isopentenyl adenosine(37)-C2)-methylthiotransferase MiaB [Elusimicrobiota bacterium]
MKIHVISFGCQMSVADGEEMVRPLGLEPTEDLEEAGIVLVNTCTVREHAEHRALSLIGRLKGWKEAKPGRLLVVAGCAAQRAGVWIERRFPYVDLVIGALSVEQYPNALRKLLDKQTTPPRPRNAVSAFVNIMRGCDFACSYCIVPKVRGPERSRPFDDIIREVSGRVDEGAKEVMLLGQTVNAYHDSGRDFADLLRAVDKVGGLARIRFMSPHPSRLDERMTAAMAECPKVCPHLHLPVQSGSDRILAAMRRTYTRAKFLEKVAALRRLVPDLALTTDIIVGFPGETEEDFKETLSVVQDADLCGAYCTKYSPRQGTPAYPLGDPVLKAVKEERLSRLLSEVGKGMERHLRALLGKRLEILLDTPTDGRTRYYFHARLEEPAKAGSLVTAEVTGCTETALKCHIGL